MKKILCLVLVSILMLSSTAFALCERNFSVTPPRNISTKNDLVCMDFSLMNPGDNPGFDVQGSNAAIIKTEGVDGKEQSALCITDTTTSDDYNSGANVYKNIIPTQKGIVKVEVRFKYEPITTETMSMNIFIYGGKNYLHRLYIGDVTPTFSLQSSGNGSFTLNNGANRKPGTWYTFTAMLNLDESHINSKLVEHNAGSDLVTYVESFSFAPTFVQGESSVDQLHLQTNRGDGNLIVDYIKVEKSDTDAVKEYVKRDPFPLPYTSTPGPKAVDGIVNVKYNGEYMYFAKPPVMADGAIYVPIRNAIRALGFELSYENGVFVGNKSDARIELKRGSNTVVYNGTSHKLSAPIEDKDAALVSLNELVTIVGASASYDAALNEYIIDDKEAVQ